MPIRKLLKLKKFDTKTALDKIKTRELAERIYNVFIYDMRDADYTVSDIELDISSNPKKVIEFLIDYIENP